MKLTRRTFLRGSAGMALALPFLELWAPRRAWADTSMGRPKRLITITHQQGTVLNQWLPSGDERNFVLGPLLQPLREFQDRMVVVAGLDNMIPGFNSTGNGHQNADLSLLTCQPFQNQNAEPLLAGGPSIEQVIAERIGGDAPFQRLDLAIGGGRSGQGLVTSPKHWYGAGDPVAFISDPLRGLTTLFGQGTLDEAALEALRLRRTSVLDAVQENFNAMRGRLGAADRIRLDAHADKIRQLELRITSEANAACARPDPSLPEGYDYGFDDDITMPVQIDLLVNAMACGQSRVGNLWFASGHDPTFPWLSVNGGPVVPTDRYDNWHAMVHDGRSEQGLITGFTWYAEQVASLLRALSEQVDTDGDNMLDTSLVVWLTEFGNGAGHNTLKIPALLFGCLGGEETGRFLDHMNGGPDDNYVRSDASTGQLFVSMLRMFGGEDEVFGITDPALPRGPLAGLT